MKDFSIKILKQGEIFKHSVYVQMKVPCKRSEKNCSQQCSLDQLKIHFRIFLTVFCLQSFKNRFNFV